MVAVAIFYVSKAFDHTNHKTLLSKVNIYGIRGISLDLIKSHLCFRKQAVSTTGNASAFQPISSEVIQGTTPI